MDGSGNRVGEREREGGGGVGWCMRENGYKKAVKPKQLTAQQWTAVQTKSTSVWGSPTPGTCKLSVAFLNCKTPHLNSRDDNDVQIPRLSSSAG